MIFPSAAVEQARRELAGQLEAAAEAPESAFTGLLALAPHERIALFELSRLRQQSGDLPAAEQFCRRGLRSHPCDYRFYVQLACLLSQQGRDLALANGFLELGVLKLVGDPDSREDATRLHRKGRFPGTATDFDDPVALESFAALLVEKRESEGAEVTAELHPLRLIHEVQECFGNELDRALVDEILQDPQECGPLLLGVLRGFSDGYLPEGGALMAEAALALLGEMGDVQSLPALVEFAVTDDPEISDIASWALLRVAENNPAGTVAAMRNFDRTAGGAERSCMAETLATMPEAPGKPDALLALLDNFQAVRENERADTWIVISAGLLSVLGQAAPSVIRKALARNARLLTAEARASTGDLLQAFAADPSVFAIGSTKPVPTVYDICCSDRLSEPPDSN
jgi:hypothetical protein